MTHRAESAVVAVAGKVANLATTGARVYRGRVYPVTAFPCLLIYQGPERIAQRQLSDFVDAELMVYIEARVQSAADTLETQLNAIREEITVALMADYKQGTGFIIDTIEGDTDAPELSGEGDQPIGTLRTTWRLYYRRTRTNPGA